MSSSSSSSINSKYTHNLYFLFCLTCAQLHLRTKILTQAIASLGLLEGFVVFFPLQLILDERNEALTEGIGQYTYLRVDGIVAIGIVPDDLEVVYDVFLTAIVETSESIIG